MLFIAYIFYLLFHKAHKSFELEAKRAQNGTFMHSYTKHLQYKKRTRLVSAVSLMSALAFAIGVSAVNIILPPIQGYALDRLAQSDDVAVTVVEVAKKTVKKYPRLNVTDYLINKKGKVYIKDSLKVKKNALIKGNANIKGSIKNTKSSSPVTIDDNLNVDGRATLNNIVLNQTDTSALDTTALQGGNVYYEQADNKLYLWDGSAWKDLTQQDTTYTAGVGIEINENNIISNTVTDTDSNTTYTAGDGLALASTEFSIDQNFSPNWTNTHTFEEDPTLQKSDASIIFDTATDTDTDFWIGVIDDGQGDNDDIFSIGRGTTTGSSVAFSINQSGNVGIGTSPDYKFHVQNGNIALQHTASNAVLLIDAATDNDASILFRENATNSWVVGFDGDNGNIFEIQDWNGGGWDTDLTISTGGEVYISGVGGDGDGKVVCIKADNNLGTCTTGVDAGGACTCN